MGHNTKENTSKEINKVKVSTHMRTEEFMKVNGIKIRYKDLGRILGQMGKPILVNGKKIICMAKGYLLGLMGDVMKESITRIKKRVLVFTHGLMGDSTQGNGSMGNSMAKVFIKI